MKRRTVNAREFQHQLASIAAALKPGESVVVTKRGEHLGTFTRAAKKRTMPDFLANLKKVGQNPKKGQAIIEEICGIR